MLIYWCVYVLPRSWEYFFSLVSQCLFVGFSLLIVVVERLKAVAVYTCTLEHMQGTMYNVQCTRDRGREEKKVIEGSAVEQLIQDTKFMKLFLPHHSLRPSVHPYLNSTIYLNLFNILNRSGCGVEQRTKKSRTTERLLETYWTYWTYWRTPWQCGLTKNHVNYERPYYSLHVPSQLPLPPPHHHHHHHQYRVDLRVIGTSWVPKRPRWGPRLGLGGGLVSLNFYLCFCSWLRLFQWLQYGHGCIWYCSGQRLKSP